LESNKQVFLKSHRVQLDGGTATQLEFEGEMWAVVIPQRRFTFVVLFQCQVKSCARHHEIRKKTRDSIKIDRSF
jgi:hypothetical protein